MIIGGAAAAPFVPPAKTPILLVALHFSIGSDNFVPLVHRAFEVRRSDPVIMKIDAHAVLEIHSHLDSVISIDAVTLQPPLLSHGSQRGGLATIIMIDQIDP